MSAALEVIGEGFANAFLMAWQVWWALVLGFAISAVVQAWVPRERIQSALGGGGPRPIALATGLGAASQLRGDRDRQVALPEGCLGGQRARLPVRIHEPRGGARVGRAAAPDDVPAVAACLTSAFYDDPAWGLWTFPEEASRAQRLYELMRFWGNYRSGVAVWSSPATPS